MAVPSACWPHAVFPGLSGNKGRKTPFYSITPAALGHRANTKESGFIKTISARNQPNKLIYHQPCSEWEGLRRHRDRLVFRGCGWFPDSVHKKDRHLSPGPHFYQMCVCSCCACISEWVGGFEETWQQLPIQSSRQNATLTAVCTLVFFFVFFHAPLSVSKAHETRGRRKRRKHECSACEAIGDLGRIHTREKKEWKEGRDAAWGPTQETDVIYIWEVGVRRNRRRGGGENSSMDQRSENTQKVGCISEHSCAENDKLAHRVWYPALFLAEEMKETVVEWRQQTPWFNAVI